MADYEIWDESQTDYGYKNSKGKWITDSSSSWTFSAYANYYYGSNWVNTWRFGKFWWIDYCDTDGCEEKFPEVNDIYEDDVGFIFWVNQFSDADWKKYGEYTYFTKDEF